MSKPKPAYHLERYPWFDTVRAQAPSRGLRLIGETIILLGVLGVIFGLAAAFVFGVLGDRIYPLTKVFFATFCVIVFGIAIYTAIRQLFQPDGFELLKNDLRPPVLFLRSFQEDERRIQDKRLLGDEENRELAMINSLRELGPFVAIGKPGDHFPRLGAARLYVTDAYWRDVVMSLLSHATAVILQPDDTPGTRWEISTAASFIDLRRLLLIVPNPEIRPLAYQRVRRALGECFPPLPEAPNACDAFVFENGVPRALYFEGDSARLVAEVFVRQILSLPEERNEC